MRSVNFSLLEKYPQSISIVVIDLLRTAFGCLLIQRTEIILTNLILIPNGQLAYNFKSLFPSQSNDVFHGSHARPSV